MKKIQIILLSTLTSMMLITGCSSGNGQSTNQIENNKGVSTETPIVKEQEKEVVEVGSKLQDLQPGKFESDLAKAYYSYEQVYYDDLLRYSNDYIGKKIKVSGTVDSITHTEDGTIKVYLKDVATNNFYFLYYFKEDMDESPIAGDFIHAMCEMDDIGTITSTNQFGAEIEATVPGMYIEYMTSNSFTESYNAINEYIDVLKYDIKLVGQAKDFKDLSGKRGYVFAITSLDGSTYEPEYIYGENGKIWSYSPTVDGKNINGTNIALSEYPLNAIR